VKLFYTGPVVNASLTVEKQWVRSYLDDVYLWYGEVPAVNPADPLFSADTTAGFYTSINNYFNALRTLIDSKIKGREVAEFEVEEVPRLDIMSALKKSLQASSRKPMVKAPATADKKKPQITLVKPRAAKKRKVG